MCLKTVVRRKRKRIRLVKQHELFHLISEAVKYNQRSLVIVEIRLTDALSEFHLLLG